MKHPMGIVALFAMTAMMCGACRAVLGIEDQPVDDAVDAGGADAVADVVSPADAADARTKPEPTAACVGKAGGDCIKCCRDLAPSANAAFDQALSTGCLCAGEALCQTPCAADLCAGGPPGSPGTACLSCVTQNTTSPACADAFATCRANVSCAPIADCVEGTCQ